MKMIKQVFFVMLYLAFSMSSSYATRIDKLGKTTIYLREETKCHEWKGGKKYEIWLKDTVSQHSQPKLATKGGTGFLTLHHKRTYLVTAAHVARYMSSKAEILWNTASGQSKHFTFEKLQKGIPYSKWFFHPSADMAIHPFIFTEKPEHKYVQKSLFWTEDEVIPLGTKVCVLGFPLNLGVKDILSPILKKAEIASWKITVEDPYLDPNLKFILLDEDLAQGYSGAPVFISPEPQMSDKTLMDFGIQLKLLGIMSMTISDQTGGKMSLVVPISYLNEIFTSNDFNEYEKRVGIK